MSVSRHRWLTKKAARGAVMLGSWASGSLAVRDRIDPGPTVRVLTYHRFGDAVRDPWCVSTRTFEAQMGWLAEHGLAISLDDLLAFVQGKRTLPHNAALVTMDDGFSSVYTVAGPILKRYAIPAVAFITTSVVDSGDAASSDSERYLRWDEVARLPELGITVGSHAHTHRSLGRMPVAEARSEGERSRELLERCLGHRVHTFAYPYGMHPDETPDTARALGESGYSSVFIAQHGTIQRGADPLRLPRVKVEGGEHPWLFGLQCKGAIDLWKVFDNTLWRLQKPAG